MSLFDNNNNISRRMKLQLVRFPGYLSERLLHFIDVHLGEKSVKTVIPVSINVLMNYGNS